MGWEMIDGRLTAFISSHGY